MAKNVSSSSRLGWPLQSSSASAFSSAMFTGSHGAYAHIQSCDAGEGPLDSELAHEGLPLHDDTH